MAHTRPSLPLSHQYATLQASLRSALTSPAWALAGTMRQRSLTSPGCGPTPRRTTTSSASLSLATAPRRVSRVVWCSIAVVLCPPAAAAAGASGAAAAGVVCCRGLKATRSHSPRLCPLGVQVWSCVRSATAPVARLLVVAIAFSKRHARRATMASATTAKPIGYAGGDPPRVDQHWARMHGVTASGVECVGMLRLLRRNQRDVSPLA